MLNVTMSIPADCRSLAPRLRTDDVAEVLASSGDHPLAALEKALRLSKACWSLRNGEGELIGMFGVGVHPLDPKVGVPWLLAADGLTEESKSFLRGCKSYVRLMQAWYPVLTNLVDERNVVSQRWLEWCGFFPYKTFQRFGVGKLPFIQYVRYQDV